MQREQFKKALDQQVTLPIWINLTPHIMFSIVLFSNTMPSLSYMSKTQVLSKVLSDMVISLFWTV
ncbi:MAG: hypothetical protein A4E30_01606 [Methanomassiliicoccales archaeon PtaB.Bin215]|nr:MAG: hypothetical protein A4E30_01606 [Methanomassiliicoccales archaeon PtaB.Bin215]